MRGVLPERFCAQGPNRGLQRVAARDLYDLACDEPCLLACEEEDRVRDVLGLDQLPHGDEREDGFFELLVNPACLGGTRCNTIDGNTILRHFQRESSTASALDALA